MAEALIKSEAIAYSDDAKKVRGVCEFYDSRIIVRDNNQTEKISFEIKDYEDISVLLEAKKGFLKKNYCLIFSSKVLNKRFLTLSYKNIENAETCKKVLEKKIKETAEINSKNKKYDEACNLLSKDTKDALNQSIAIFSQIYSWKNSKNLIEKARIMIEEIEKDELYFRATCAIERAEKSSDKSDYIEAVDLLSQIKDWKDSDIQLSNCQRKLNEIIEKENKAKQEKYNAAIIEAKKDTISAYEKAIRILSSIVGWKDSDQLIKTFNKRIDEIRIAEENARKEHTYSDALKIAAGQTVKDQEKAIKLFTDVIDWKDARDQIENCKRTKKHIEEVAFYNKIDNIISTSKQEADNPQKYFENIQKASKSALNLILSNPYFILGISCLSEQSKMLDVKDKIEKFARLKLNSAYKSTFDLKNVNKPSRDIGNVQSAIVAAKEISSKWLWFETDKYCSWWDREEIFALYENEKESYEYDLMLACLINRIVCDPIFSDFARWNLVFLSIERIVELPKNDLNTQCKKAIAFI